jgi:hypothetical protein
MGEEYQQLIEKAYKEAKLADYMVYVTSKLVKDKKVLISVIDHINKSFILSITAYLTREREYRRVPPVPKEPLNLIELFFTHCAKDLNVENSLKNIITKINKALKAYDERGMLLQRSNKYVFISGSYELIDLKPKDVKEWLKLNIDFVNVLKQELSEK